MPYRTLRFPFLSNVLFGTALLAASQPPAIVFDWQKCIDQVTVSNPEVSAAKNTLRSNEFQTRAAYGGFFPQLSGTLNYSYGNGSGNGGGGTTFFGGPTGATSRYTASLSVSQNLFNGFQDKAKVDQAAANREVSRANLSSVKAKLSFDLKSAFAGLVYAQRAVKLSEDIILRRNSNLKLVELRYDSGRENRGSVLLSKAYLEQAKLDFLQASNAVGTAQAQLARVLGIEDSDDLEVRGSVPIEGHSPPRNFKERAQETPDYLSAVNQEKAAEAAFVGARAGFFPIFAVTGSTSNSGNDFFPADNRWQLGASITFPFFSGGRDYYTTKAASESRKAAVLAKENSLRVNVTKLKQASAGFTEAIQRLESDRAFAEAAEARAKIARQKYNNGLLTFDDWDIIENDLINRQKSYLQSERDRVTAEATWEQAQGKGVIP